jgi:2-oxoisovalerate dehydrogenase E2 component (dihydrolipoyl transacylase)
MRREFGSIKKFYLPDLGEKIKEATVKAWHVKEGDPVEEF